MFGVVSGTFGPEQPLLFFLDGLDMRWRSLATVAEQVDGGRRALAALGLPAGAVVAFTWRAGPDAVAADLAIRAGGWTALPLIRDVGPRDAETGGERHRPAPPEAAARLLLPGEADASEEPARVARLPPAATELSGRRDRGELDAPLPALAELGGGALVCSAVAGGAPAWRTASPSEIADRAAALADRLAGGGGPSASRPDPVPAGWRRRRWARPSRPVVVACLDPSTPEGRLVLDWALAAGSALYLEPDAWALGGIAGWCRPTVVAGDSRGMASVAAEIRRREAGSSRIVSRVGALVAEGLRRLWDSVRGERAGAEGTRRPGPPFGRLRTALLLGSAESGARVRLGADDLTLFACHGVDLLTPQSGLQAS